MEMQRISGICQPAVVEDSGVISGGYTVVETPVETPAVEVAVETPEPEVVIEAPAPEKPVEVKPVTSSAIFEADKICIVEREVLNVGSKALSTAVRVVCILFATSDFESFCFSISAFN